LPAGTRALVNVAVVAGVHIAAGVLACVGIPECRGSGVAMASL
jgi:hypothetical protein